MDALDVLGGAETRRAHADDGAEHGETGWEALGELVPVVGHETVEGFDTFDVGAESADGHVDILLFDFTAEGEGESSLNQFGSLGSAKGSKGCVALVAVGGVAVCIENDVVL